jgi:hypothetical protein
MDYRTGHSIISGTKYSTWPGRLEESAAFDRDNGFIFIKFSNRNSARF